MASLLLLSLLSLIIYTQRTQSIFIKTESLTALTPEVSGALVLTHLSEVETVNKDTQWSVSTQSQNTWQFIVILDQTWGFNPLFPSSITVSIHSPTISRSNTFADIVLGFTTNHARHHLSNNGYFSVLIPMRGDSDSNQTNQIFPNCVAPGDRNKYGQSYKSAFAIGDIASIPNFNRDCDLSGYNCDDWQSMKPNNAGSIIRKFPIDFVFLNDPISHSLTVTLNSAQTCVFYDLPTNQGFKIYFGGSDNDDKFVIDSFDVTYDILGPTQNPTFEPTNAPSETTVTPSNNPSTDNPSVIPTLTPSNNPSNMPISTDNPTQTPSNNPTNVPISTKNPSVIPTRTPSDMPTLNPSQIPTVNPSNMASVTPSNIPTQMPLEHTLECGRFEKGFMSEESVMFGLDIAFDVQKLVINTCHSFTDFNTTLAVFTADMTQRLAFDSEGCHDGLGRSEIVINGMSQGMYRVILAPNDRWVEGLYRIDVGCEVSQKMAKFCQNIVGL